MDFSFVILTWNSEKHIESCLQSILAGSPQPHVSCEILIIDNGSADRTPQILEDYRKKHSQVTPIFLKSNHGTTYPRNIALKKSCGDFVIVMDSDVEVAWESILRLRKLFDANPEIGLAVPRLLYPDGRHQKSTDRFPTLHSKLLRYFFLRKIETREAEGNSPQNPIEVDYAISAFWMFRRNLLDDVGYLDEAIFYAPEDVDYCLRIWEKGYRIILDPDCTAVHHTQEFSRGFRFNRLAVEHIKGLAHYFWKHRYLFRRPQRATGSIRICR
ncbi:MAG: glycosyltransferase [Acidobacteria bacterium]|nr:glycosyltransferase [Acidobacteriota bacterium]